MWLSRAERSEQLGKSAEYFTEMRRLCRVLTKQDYYMIDAKIHKQKYKSVH